MGVWSTSALGSADLLLSRDQGEVKRSLVADSDPDTYKIVFPTEGGADEFGELLNKAGEQSYNLLSVMYRWQRLSGFSDYRMPVGILKCDSSDNTRGK